MPSIKSKLGIEDLYNNNKKSFSWSDLNPFSKTPGGGTYDPKDYPEYEIVSPDDEMYMGGGVADLVKNESTVGPGMTTEQLIEGGKIPPIDYSGNVDEASPELLKALQDNNMDELKKLLGAPETSKQMEEEEEIKTGKDYSELGFFQKLLKAATENPEATLALGRALLKGEGLGIGLADFAEEKIAQDKAEAALEKEAEETLYERKLKEREFELDVAKAEDLAKYYAQMGYAAEAKTNRPLKEIEYGVYYAQLARDSQGNPLKPGTAEFDAKVIEGMENYSKNSKDGIMEFLTGGQTDQNAETTEVPTVGNNTIYKDLNK